MNPFTTWTRPLNWLELDVLATISRGCDPLPSESHVVNRLASNGLVVFDPMNASSVIGYRITDYGKQALSLKGKMK